MNLRKVFVGVFLALTAGALGMELWAGLDSSSTTVPWTELISDYVPQPITLTAISVLATWLPTHFVHNYVGKTPPDRYSKALVPAVVAGLLALQAAITDDVVTRPELLAVLAAVLSGLGVYATPNGPKEPASVALLREQWQRESR